MTLQIKRRRLTLPEMNISTSSKWIGYLSVFSVLAVINILLGNGTIGQIVIIIYGIFALVFNIRSDEIFKLAFVAFGVIPITTIFSDEILAKYFATYTFLLLCIGVTCALKEQWRVAPVETPEVSGKRYVHPSLPVYREKEKSVFINRRLR